MTAPDIIYRGGKIVTVNPTFRIAEAFAITGDRFSAVGSTTEISALAGPDTKIVDLKGQTVLPGLVDAHAHMDREGLKAIYPSLGGARSIKDVLQKITDLAKAAKPGEWIVTMPIGDPPFYPDVPGVLAENRFPTRQELDAAAPRNPVFIRPIWGFWNYRMPLVSCANSEALRRAGITRDTVPPIDLIRIDKDADGEPTGIIYEQTIQSIAELVYFREAPGFSHKQRVEALPRSQQAYLSYGTTSTVEAHGAAMELIRAYKECHRQGKLSMRALLAFSPNWPLIDLSKLDSFSEAWLSLIAEPALGDDHLKIGGLWVEFGPLQDNVLRTQTGPYTSWAGFNYDTGLPDARVKQLLLNCARNNIRVFGIRSNLLSLFEEVDREIPLNGRRWVMGHITAFTKEEIATIKRLGIVVSTHTSSYISRNSIELRDRIGADRENDIVPLRALIDAGVTVTLATDNVPITLWPSIWHTVSRTTRFGSKIAPTQAISREEAIRCATLNGAYLTFEEAKKGSIEPGKLADFTILDGDPLTMPEEKLKDVRAVKTVVGGKIAYERI